MAARPKLSANGVRAVAAAGAAAHPLRHPPRQPSGHHDAVVCRQIASRTPGSSGQRLQEVPVAVTFVQFGTPPRTSRVTRCAGLATVLTEETGAQKYRLLAPLSWYRCVISLAASQGSSISAAGIFQPGAKLPARAFCCPANTCRCGMNGSEPAKTGRFRQGFASSD